jgi:DNA-binding LytR/AlgR family response regulator
LIADDERLLREQLQARLAEAWPELVICGTARDGLEAVSQAQALRPDVVFLDIRMPGLNGIEAAREIASLADWTGEIVFVTAYDEYAVAAFEQGALDYLLKPVEPGRLAQAAQRVAARLAARQAEGGSRTAPFQANTGDRAHSLPVETANTINNLLEKLSDLERTINRSRQGASANVLRWIQCSAGTTTRLVDVNDVIFFRSDEKYTRVQTSEREYLIRTPIRDLVTQLDGQVFWQIHRSTVVSVAAIASVWRDESGRQRVNLRDHPEVLEVSRSFAHLFRCGPGA